MIRRRLAFLLLSLLLAACGTETEERTEVPAGSSSSSDEPVYDHRKIQHKVGKLSPDGPESAPNRFESRAFGFAIEKPDGWVFLPESCVQEDSTARVTNIAGLWEVIGPCSTVPLVAMAPRVDPVPGVDPIIRVMSKINTPPKSAQEVSFLTSAPPERLVISFAQDRSGRPGYVSLQDPTPAVIGSSSGAVARAQYQREGETVEEQFWFVQHGLVFWWLEALAPAPFPDELNATIAAVRDSFRLEDPPILQ